MPDKQWICRIYPGFSRSLVSLIMKLEQKALLSNIMVTIWMPISTEWGDMTIADGRFMKTQNNVRGMKVNLLIVTILINIFK